MTALELGVAEWCDLAGATVAQQSEPLAPEFQDISCAISDLDNAFGKRDGGALRARFER
jgi:hypothetical protein